ncbi:MAG: insulinase family protein [candidate division Zixibacteria bacterium]|nr:insulinase family protein [Candidatus Tariuqbacter arcticus]
MKYILPILLLTAFASLAAQPEIYTLDNGMEVVLIENHASPVIASSVIVRTGLRDETIGIIGASHFLEHLLFNGTTHRTQEELYEEMDLLGGYNNAHTGESFTNFIILMNKENFEQGLEIQTDMLFNSTIPNEKYQKERGIVIEEIGQSHDRSSYIADIHFAQRFFKGTPYAFQVLGPRRSIENMKRADILRYYQERYVPNNMTAIITGDFNPREIKKVVDKYLGAPSPAKFPERKYLEIQLPLEPGVAPVSYHYEETNRIFLRVGLPAPDRMGEDYYVGETLTDLLGKRLGKVLSGGEKPLTQSFNLEYLSDIDFGAIILRAQLPDAGNISPVIEAFQRSFYELSEGKITTEEIRNSVIAQRSQSLFYSERPHFFAMMKAHQLAFHGYEFVANYYDNLLKVAPQEVKTLAGELYDYAPFIPVAVLPYPTEGEEEQTAESEAQIYRETLKNGLEVVIAPGSGSGVLAAHFLFKNRSLNEPQGKTGITNFLHNALLKGTANHSEAELGDRMNGLGMNIEVGDNPRIPFDDYRTTPKFSFIRMETIDDYWSKALELTAEIIRKPSFSPGAMEAVRGRLIGAAARGSESASAKAKLLFYQKLLSDYVLAMNVNGNMMTLSGVTREDLLDYHHRYFSPDNMILTIVGSPPAEKIAEKVKALFGEMEPSGISAVESPEPVSQVGEYKEKLGKKQSYIYLGYLIEEIPEQDRAPLAVANSILSDKMQFQLREQQGLAYSLGASVSLQEGWGYFLVRMGTGPENIETALAGIKEQINLASKGKFTEKDVTKAVNSYMGRRNMRLLTSVNRAYYMGIYAMEDKPLDSAEKWLEEIKAVTYEDARACAKKYFKTDDLVIVVVE